MRIRQCGEFRQVDNGHFCCDLFIKMEDTQENCVHQATNKRKHSLGPFMREQKKLRVSGKSYKTGTGNNKQAKQPPQISV